MTSDRTPPPTSPEAWVAVAQVDDAVGERRRTGWLAQQAVEEGTLAGALVELAEQESAVVLSLAPEGQQQGRIFAVGPDAVVLTPSGGGTVVVPLRAIAAIRLNAGAPSLWGDRSPTPALSWHGLLSAWCGERPEVTVIVPGGSVHGELVTVGIDVLTVLERGDRRVRTIVALDRVVAVTSRERLAV